MFFFFFFQAEDGIRDLTVTGVQTLCSSDLVGAADIDHQDIHKHSQRRLRQRGVLVTFYGITHAGPSRSEERRVGKEWRSRWAAYDEEKKERRDQEVHKRNRTT